MFLYITYNDNIICYQHIIFYEFLEASKESNYFEDEIQNPIPGLKIPNVSAENNIS